MYVCSINLVPYKVALTIVYSFLNIWNSLYWMNTVNSFILEQAIMTAGMALFNPLNLILVLHRFRLLFYSSFGSNISFCILLQKLEFIIFEVWIYGTTCIEWTQEVPVGLNCINPKVPVALFASLYCLTVILRIVFPTMQYDYLFDSYPLLIILFGSLNI